MTYTPRPSDPPAPVTPPPHQAPHHCPPASAPMALLGATTTRVLALAGLALIPWFAEHALRPASPTVVMVISAMPAPAPAQTAQLAQTAPSATQGTITQAPPPSPPSITLAPPPITVRPAVAPVVAVAPERPVQVRWGTGWYAGSVVRPECGRLVRIQFTGYGPEWEDVVSLDDIRDPSQPRTSVEGRSASDGAAEPDPATLTRHDRVVAGMALEANDGSSWYPAHVLQVHSDGRVRIHYDGYGSEWDESMTRDRLRRRGSAETRESSGMPAGTAVDGQTTLLEGQHLWARSGPTWYLADVVRGECGGLVRVHYRGWERAWDEAVPRDRLRLPASTPANAGPRSTPAAAVD